MESQHRRDTNVMIYIRQTSQQMKTFFYQMIYWKVLSIVYWDKLYGKTLMIITEVCLAFYLVRG